MKLKDSLTNLKRHSFLFEQLVKRDFEHKYKRTALGALWSVLSPLLTLLVMKVVFTQFFGRNTPHYTIYLFAGNIIFSYYREATTNGMQSLMQNANVIDKINLPKYLFVFSRNVQAFFNFLLTVLVFFVFCIFDHIEFGFHMLMLIYPIICLLILNVGIGLFLSAIYIFFRDMTYLYQVFLTLLNYLSAVFYTIDGYSPTIQKLFLLNPVYVSIKYFRTVVIDGVIPSFQYHLLMLGYSLFFMALGSYMYKKYNHQFIYYL
ncbi:MAG: ABC transporter permease [Erysipelotrichaceae bacterium]|nr:ABC transporter permease [Erysipelotrichaceae bacterium]